MYTGEASLKVNIVVVPDMYENPKLQMKIVGRRKMKMS